MIRVNNDSKIYIICPAYTKTGGTELLHQLAYKIRENGRYCIMSYCGATRSNPIHRDPAFDKYIQEEININDIEDKKENIVIIPEICTFLVNKFENVQKVIWWLSVDNYVRYTSIRNAIKSFGVKDTVLLFMMNHLSFKHKFVRKSDFHLCQCYYAIDYVKKLGIKEENIGYLSDYINDTFTKNDIFDINKKEDIVLYNPKKGYEYTKKIIEKAKNIKFIPLINLTTEEVKNLLLKSKVYIDFGNHPGKDRFPREAAMCGCCVITDKKGSANFEKDVPINEEFKFEDIDGNIENVVKKIEYCLKDYNNEVEKFNEYREFIKKEEKNFEKDVRKLFI